MKGTTQKNYISVGDIVEVNDVTFKAEPMIKGESCLKQCDATFKRNPHCSGLCYRYVNGEEVVFKKIDDASEDHKRIKRPNDDKEAQA
ncbi:MAG: hypothetical protein IIV89_02120 [Bacteroidaceae bacterium]|nr:hypothetical protein [Bacteroidaceae bacterium]